MSERHMINDPGTFLYKLQLLFTGTLIIVAGLFLLVLLLSALKIPSAQAKEKDASSRTLGSEMAESPNAVTSGMAQTVGGLGKTLSSVAYAADSAVQSVGSVTAQAGKYIAQGAQAGISATVRGVGRSFAAVGDGVAFTLRAPGNVWSFVANTSAVQTVIRPSNHVEVPIIDPNSPELRAALAALPPKKDVQSAATQPNQGPQWPMHGRVTAHFGVDHRPFQHTHTGIDISDGQPSGTTPVKPFRPGRVIDVVHSNRGLGNYVIVDHGNGVTSVYAHLASISVQEGATVNLDTILGLVGSTGLSTGPHLHLEIRVHGKAANPQQFISGHP